MKHTKRKLCIFKIHSVVQRRKRVGEQTTWLGYKTCRHHRGARREVIMCVFSQKVKVIDCKTKVFSFTIWCHEPTPQVPCQWFASLLQHEVSQCVNNTSFMAKPRLMHLCLVSKCREVQQQAALRSIELPLFFDKLMLFEWESLLVYLDTWFPSWWNCFGDTALEGLCHWGYAWRFVKAHTIDQIAFSGFQLSYKGVSSQLRLQNHACLPSCSSPWWSLANPVLSL